MEIVNSESFGPVAPLVQVDDFDEALALANDREYGLGANIYTKDLEEAMRAVDEIDSGMVWVNNPLARQRRGAVRRAQAQRRRAASWVRRAWSSSVRPSSS